MAPLWNSLFFRFLGWGGGITTTEGGFLQRRKNALGSSACGGSSSCYTGMERLGPLVVGVHM